MRQPRALGWNRFAVEEVEAVLVILEDCLPSVATGHHLVGRAGVLEAERSRPAPGYRGTTIRPIRNSEFKD